MSDFEDRARAAGRGLGAVAPAQMDPTFPRKRLRRRRIAAATTAFVVVAGVGGGVALARRDTTHTTVHVANDNSTTTTASPETSSTTAPTTTTTPETTTTVQPAPTTTTVPPGYLSAFTAGLSGVVSVQNGKVVLTSARGSETLLDVAGATSAYRLHAGIVVGTDSSVVVDSFGSTHTIGDMTLVGTGVYHGHSVALTLDLHPDVLHDNAKFISIYDLATGQLTRTKLSMAPGTTLDHVSVAGELFVMSGKSAEGGPFVLYRHADGSFDDTLWNPVPGRYDHGIVSDAVISPDGTRIAYLVDQKILWVNDVKTGNWIIGIGVTIYGGRKVADGLDYDGVWAVVTDTQDAMPPLVLTTKGGEHDFGPLPLDGALGWSTLDRG